MQDIDLDPPSEPVIACTLTAADLRDRQRAWLKLGRYLVTSQPIPGGLNLRFASAPGLYDSLAELVRLEAECCAWMTFALDHSAAAVRLSITASGGDGERGVREAFAPLRQREVTNFGD